MTRSVTVIQSSIVSKHDPQRQHKHATQNKAVRIEIRMMRRTDDTFLSRYLTKKEISRNNKIHLLMNTFTT